MKFHVKHSQKFFEKLWFIYGQRIYKAMVHKHTNFYLKPNDIISHRPTLFGYHEPHIEKLINDVSEQYSDFLLDLGANIGLTSSLVGRGFKRIDCVEPNELVFNILKTNLALNLKSDTYQCHMVGLGREDGILKLIIPRDNFGGAFIEADNKILDKKKKEATSAQRFNEEGFIEVEVKIKQATNWLKKYFAELKKKKLSQGIIKIDVEGYEEVIFKSIVSTLPKDFEVLVVMENWFENFPTNKFSSSHHNLSWSYFKKIKRPIHSIPFKMLGLSSSYRHEVRELTENTLNPHDVICLISSKGR